MRTDFESDLSGLRSEFQVTAASLHTEFTDDIGSLRGELTVTASGLRTDFESDLSGLRSEFQVTAASLHTEFTDEASCIRSELVMSASSLRIAFEGDISSVRSSINVQRDRIDLVVEGTGANAKIKAAQITTAINEAGSNVLLSADHITLDGNTKLSGQLAVESGGLKVKTTANFSGGDVTVTGTGATVHSTNFHLYSGGSISFAGASPGSTYSLTASDVQNMIISASVDEATNTLTLTPKTGEPITFRKAASTGNKVSGSWSGSTLTVAQSVTGVDAFATTITAKLAQVTNPNKYYITAYKQDAGDAYPSEIVAARTEYNLANINNIVKIVNSGGTQIIDTPTYVIPLTTKSVTANGTYTPGSSYVGFSSVTVNVPSDLNNARVRFGGSSGSYYVEAYDGTSGNYVPNSSISYKLGRSGTSVQSHSKVKYPLYPTSINACITSSWFNVPQNKATCSSLTPKLSL